jgi:hypothetical protein
MTALHYILTDEELIVAMDSLGLETTPDGDRCELKFVTKVFPLPHLRALLCGTGSLELVLRWFLTIQHTIVADDILYLDTIGPQMIRDLHREHVLGADSTIYHFGVHPGTGKLCGFALPEQE